MTYCEECGSTYRISYSAQFMKYLCPSCEKLNEEHPVNPIPPSGDIVYDEEGRPICHICGRAYDRLMSHARQKHEISARSYKEKFGLNTSRGIISPRNAEVLRIHISNNYEKVVKDNLLMGGVGTRFEEGCSGRTKDKLSLQALNDLKNRGKA